MKFGGNFERKLNQSVERPPVAAGDVFEPEEELKTIRHFPREEQRQKLAELKDKLSYQKKGLAAVQEQMVKIILANPNAPFQELYGRAVALGAKFGMNEQQKELASKFLQKYAERHARIKEVRKEYPDNKDLYAALFGVRPKGRIEVIEGPVTLYFRCQNFDDYAIIYSGKFFPDESVTENNKKMAKMSGGAKVDASLRIPGLEGTIIAENSSRIGHVFKRHVNSKNTLKHEEQHAIKDLLRGGGNEMAEVWVNFLQARTDRERKLALERYLVLRKQAFVAEKVKDEILAFFKADPYGPSNILKFLIKPESKGGLYDHNEADKKIMKQYFADKPHLRRFQGLAEMAIDDVYEREIEYEQLVKEGLDAIFLLEKAGYSRDKAIFVLIHEPLPKWKKAVARILRNSARA